MKTGTCPKCQSRTVRAKNEAVSVQNKSIYIEVGMLSRGYVRVYVCVTCGYLEQYVLDAEDLPKIAQKWPKVE
ncbi:MAG TPA: hypothetical protein VD886_23925 [Herpetosiphonaceae bacterium]|nr:hypothetical protein [Herpetosiphonaceae bacterium]